MFPHCFPSNMSRVVCALQETLAEWLKPFETWNITSQLHLKTVNQFSKSWTPLPPSTLATNLWYSVPFNLLKLLGCSDCSPIRGIAFTRSKSVHYFLFRHSRTAKHSMVNGIQLWKAQMNQNTKNARGSSLRLEMKPTILAIWLSNCNQVRMKK